MVEVSQTLVAPSFPAVGCVFMVIVAVLASVPQGETPETV